MRKFRFKQMRGAIRPALLPAADLFSVCAALLALLFIGAWFLSSTHSVLFGAMGIACMALARTFDDSIGGPCKKVRQSLTQSTEKSRSGQLS